MSTQSSLFPPLPNDTARAAAALHAKSIYLTIGDQIEDLLADIDLARLDPSGERSASTLALLALVTIFQFAENLPDRRAAKATRTHLDWKYALHLPIAYPGLDSQALCKFRQHLLDDSETLPTFQQTIDRLAECGLLRSTDKERPEAIEVLDAVCVVSRLEQLAEAMHMSLEALAASKPEWLRAMTLPHWYERYNQMLTTRCLPKSRGEQVSLAQAIGADARYLLEAIASANDDGNLALLPEVQTLRQVWHRQFNQSLHQIEWRLPSCASCTGVDEASDGLAYQVRREGLAQ
jgi:hypothetical protein